MNVLFLDQFGELGGAQRCLLDLLPAVSTVGWNACVAAPQQGELLRHAATFGAATEALRVGPYSSGAKTTADTARFLWQTPQLSRVIRRLAKRHRSDLIYVNGPRLLPAAALAARHGPPLLFHAHSLVAGSARRLVAEALRHSRASVVACCEFVAAPLRSFASEIEIVYNGVAPRQPVRSSHDGVRIGVIGRIALEKGQAEFLRAARLLHPLLQQSSQQSGFVICGAPLFGNAAAERYARELRQLAMGLPVEFTGWKQQIDEVLASLDLLIVPSTEIDATPRVILEAFAAGTPVMAFAVGGIPELIDHQATGFLVPERSAEALAAAMKRALDEPRKLPEVASHAFAKSRSHFSLEGFRERMLQRMQAAAQR